MAARLLRGSLPFLGGHCAARPLPAVRCSHSGGEERLETPSAKNLTDIGIRRIFSSEHDVFRKSIRRFFQEEVIPHHSEWEKAGEVSREVWEKAGKQGLLGVNIAEHLGGIGGDLYYAAVVWEEQAYSNCSGPGFSVHSGIVMPYITNYGSEDQIKHFIPQMTAGKCIGAIAMTEPGAGSDLQGIKTNAKKDGSDWILNGSKVFISNGWLSDVVIVVAVTNHEAASPARGISLFLVENGMKGFIKGRKLHKMGLKAQDTAELFFEDVRLPASALLGEENKGFYYIMKELPQERLLIADMAISASEFMFEETRNYVKQRKAFGKTVAHLQTVQHKLAELKTHICVTRAFVDNCLQLHEAKRLDSATACMAKYWASELQNSVAYDCVQLHGGWGYMWEYPIAKAYVDARVQPIYGGTNEIMKELIAREIVFDK
ncbi:long-chain specific acyl-CoA dehydrogenase, mitochondrial isoform X2 [Rhinopithecus roxellana]|uniref:Long-chain specific acyl-CoA dehydrogenase, mitochondrial n=1 Tax=Rhinopithecus roxellana TaxID=61622 RepID=A0A2K6NC90_RHIRO|nr:long-chain specific acyl-CoA dehydrogenase, mitochondrial isoform X2 [Rhinopithecus roxellana]